MRRCLATTDLSAILRRLEPSAGNTIVIGIDGCGGAGKSTLAGVLVRCLPHAAIIPTDDFASWDEPIEWWPRLVAQVLVPLSLGRPAHYQRYDWVARHLADWRVVEAPILILEGVSATRKEFRPYLAYKIWVECERTVRLNRGLERDGIEWEQRWLEWMRAEDAYVASHRPYETADAIVNAEGRIESARVSALV